MQMINDCPAELLRLADTYRLVGQAVAVYIQEYREQLSRHFCNYYLSEPHCLLGTIIVCPLIVNSLFVFFLTDLNSF